MSKHTPGPWKAVDEGSDYWEIESRLHGIASCSSHPPEVAANAHLIAAAPELLAALVAVLAFHSPDCERDCTIPAHKQALAAIDKARGEEPSE